jgi:prepilin-type N-terminal cleavage/methylation domain-containing protein
MLRRLNTTRGFTLVELMVSMSLGVLLLGSFLQLYTQATNATWVSSEKAEMQQDFRAAANLMQRDISMAGAGALGQQGLASNSVGLPTGAGSKIPIYPCSTTTCNYINSTSVAYPTNAGGAPLLYSIVPGYDLGITVNATEGPTDIITVSYADVSLPLNCYVVDVVSPTEVIFELPTTQLPACVLPSPSYVIPALNAAGVGLQDGDIIQFNQTALGVVTGVTTTSPTAGAYSNPAYEVTFNATDPGHINQPTIATGSLATLPVGVSNPPTVSAVRLLQITYYLDISPMDGVTPRLMRVQSGRQPAPVAENISYLKFSYDVDDDGVITANQPSLPAGVTPNMITKVNILHMSIRSQLRGTKGYQGLDLQTSVCARNLTMGQEYPISGTSF